MSVAHGLGPFFFELRPGRIQVFNFSLCRVESGLRQGNSPLARLLAAGWEAATTSSASRTGCSPVPLPRPATSKCITGIGGKEARYRSGAGAVWPVVHINVDGISSWPDGRNPQAVAKA